MDETNEFDIPPYVEPEKYASLGDEPQAHQPKNAWKVPINNFKPIDPKSYFITSGEATVKVKKLEEDAWRLAGAIRSLRMQLEKTKGVNKYLETSWDEGRLIVKQKNPRPRTSTKLINSKKARQNIKNNKKKR